jgi:nitrous oxide reductase accessory protein NosL
MHTGNSVNRTCPGILSMLLFLFLWAPAGMTFAGETSAPMPGPRDKCPVCGMFVAKYPDWIASVVYEDGHTVFFDGAKDLFKYILHQERYEKARKPGEIRWINVCSYYSMEQITAREAWYVIGSDVYGPMGRELIPLESEEEAREFLRDHRGERIVRFEDVTDELIAYLDR